MAKRKDENTLRIIGLEEKVAAPQAEPIKPKVSFDAWWLQAQQQYGLSSDLKDIVRKHFQARGFLNTGEFLKGIKDFGFHGA